MDIDIRNIKALCFDYGNTLIEFGSQAFAEQYDALERTLLDLYGHCDRAQLKEIRDCQIKAPFENGFRENNIRLITEELIRALYHHVPEKHEVDALIQARYEAFVRTVALPEGVSSILNRLRTRYRLGLISNYPCSCSIRDSLNKIGILDFFDAVVVSGDWGYVKPHPKPFKIGLSRLAVLPAECIFIGDNWLADVQGAKKIGMYAIWTTQHEPYDYIDPRPGDHIPDTRISHFNELEALLLNE